MYINLDTRRFFRRDDLKFYARRGGLLYINTIIARDTIYVYRIDTRSIDRREQGE